MFKLAAAYAEGIARNHAFADANKRTAFMAADIFLHQNGIELREAESREHADMMVKLTDRKITRNDAAMHLREHSSRLERSRSASEAGKKDRTKAGAGKKHRRRPTRPLDRPG